MDSISFVAMVAAGHIKEDDNILPTMQGISVAQTECIANWLAIATQGPVTIRHISFAGSVDISRTGPDDPQIKWTKACERKVL